MPFTIRNELRPGDIGEIVTMHGLIYSREYGFDHRFEAYVAEHLGPFALRNSNRDRIWLAERDDRIVGVVAIVESSPKIAQLRWFLVDPATRGMGLGKRLLDEAIAFSRSLGYERIILWTVDCLTDAARLYRTRGFELVEQKPSSDWGIKLTAERYELALA